MAITNALNYMIGAAWQGGQAVKTASGDLRSLDDAAIKTSLSTQTLASRSQLLDSKMRGLSKAVAGGKMTMAEATAKFKEFEKSLGPLPQGLENTTQKVGGFSSMMKQLVGAGAILAAGKQLLEFGKMSIAAASDVEEMQSKFNVVFAQEAPRVTAALDEFAGAANRSKTELMGYAATLQDTFVPLGFARDASADMSIQLVKLAEDLASFNNLNTADVVRDLQSALVGNTETLRKYGVVAQETQIKQEALALGLWDGTGAIDAQAKANAILSLTLKGTTDAQGDAINTADSYANVSKGLEAAVLDLKVAIGEGLLPTMTNAKATMADVVGAFANSVQVTNQYQQAVADGLMTQKEADAAMNRVIFTSYTYAEAQEELIVLYDELAVKTAVFTDELEGANLEYRRSATAAFDSAEMMRISGEAIREQTLAAADARGPNEELTDKFAQQTAMLTGEAAALAVSRAELNQLQGATMAAVGATDSHSSSLITLRDRLAEVEGQRTATVDLEVYGINTLERANQLLNSLQSGKWGNDMPDPYSGQGDREPTDYGDQYDQSSQYNAMGGYVGRTPGYARGGLVSNELGSPGRDSVVARLTPGEEILRRDDPRHVLNGGGGGETINVDLRGAFIGSQAEFNRMLSAALSQKGRRAAQVQRTR